MDLDVDFSEHIEGIRQSLDAFVDHAQRAGLEAPVPTTPDWTVRQLIAHQGMVHRWATAAVQGERVDPLELEGEGLAIADPVAWLRSGGHHLISALQEAPEDLKAPVFLSDAPAPRLFWARRQCHETTIHSVDALSASLGRMPTAEDTWITRQVALDGIDELLTGFMTRRSSPLRSEHPLTIGIRPTDMDRSWLVYVGPESCFVERNQGGHADAVLEASAEAIYLVLWNRSDEVVVPGFEQWREIARVTWS